jgi:hypothetical protein
LWRAVAGRFVRFLELSVVSVASGHKVLSSPRHLALLVPRGVSVARALVARVYVETPSSTKRWTYRYTTAWGIGVPGRGNVFRQSFVAVAGEYRRVKEPPIEKPLACTTSFSLPGFAWERTAARLCLARAAAKLASQKARGAFC